MLCELRIPGVVRYEGFFDGFHVYSVFCRLDDDPAILRLAYSVERTGEVKLATAVAAEPC